MLRHVLHEGMVDIGKEALWCLVHYIEHGYFNDTGVFCLAGCAVDGLQVVIEVWRSFVL